MAIFTVDTALWDLKARLLHRPLVTLLGPVCEGIPVYGSGGFTSYSIEQLQTQPCQFEYFLTTRESLRFIIIEKG
jgi:L-alanine-DL-glutamate epimerase-like enolase superfamily enzyme